MDHSDFQMVVLADIVLSTPELAAASDPSFVAFEARS